MTTKSTALTEVHPMDVALAQVLVARSADDELDEFDELLAESDEEVPFSIDRLFIKSTGFFTRDADGDEVEVGKEIAGVIVMITNPRQAFTSNDAEHPLCQSLDGITGIVPLEALADADIMEDASELGARHPVLDNPTQRVWDCRTCALNQWDTGPNGKGMACREKRALFTLPEDRDMPVIISVGTTSIATVKHYAKSCANRTDRAFFLIKTTLGTKTEKAGKNTWGKLTLTKGDRLSIEEARAIVAFQKSARAAFQAQVQRAIAEATSTDNRT